MRESSLAKKLKEARIAANLSQSDLAKGLDLSEKTISAYEKERAIPPVPTLEKIAEITNKPIQFFVQNGNGQKNDLEEISDKLDIIIKELKKLNSK